MREFLPIFVTLIWTSVAVAEDPTSCAAPAPPPQADSSVSADSLPVELSAGRAELSEDGLSSFSNGVVLRRGSRSLGADEARFDAATRNFSVSGNALYRDPVVEIRGSEAIYEDATRDVTFKDATFDLPVRPARGSAAEITTRGEKTLSLRGVTYTTCAADQEDWILRAQDIELDHDAGTGVARKVKLQFKGVPILYAPYLSFPITDQRKSGFLIPELGNTDRSGTSLSVPYYLNLAPNYDLTLAPTWFSSRGLRLDSEFRYLLPGSEGESVIEYMPDDDVTGDDRLYTSLDHVTLFDNGWRTRAELQHVSDDEYFEDFGTSPRSTSLTHLDRDVVFDYAGHHWTLLGRVQAYQTIDDNISDEDHPYKRLPQMLAIGAWPDRRFGLTYGMAGELVNFDRSDGVTGLRLDMQPSLSVPLGRPGFYTTPKLVWQHTRYELDDTEPGQDSSQTRTLPVFSLDAGLLFERDAQGRNNPLIQTFEPRLLYTHIPFREQDDLPVFDTGDPDFNVVQLFRENRFSGVDRIGDTDQVSIGVTTRVRHRTSGRQFMSATLGQAVFLSTQGVTLPGQVAETENSSDLIAELGLGIYDIWNVDLGYQYNPHDTQTSKAEVRFQFRPATRKILNLAYRYTRDDLEQSDVSLIWPVTSRWHVVGRFNYSLRDDTTLDRFLGAEYETCCWGARLISRRHISRRTGESDTSLLLQLELKGLTSVGDRADSFLESGILESYRRRR